LEKHTLLYAHSLLQKDLYSLTDLSVKESFVDESYPMFRHSKTSHQRVLKSSTSCIVSGCA